MTGEKFRMDAYYFGFTPTGVEVIDLILSAVACAGKAYHHTDQWTEATEPWHDKLRGNYPAEWIQRAAEDAAKQLDEAHAAIRAIKAAGQKFVEVDHVDEDGNVTPAYNAAYREWYQVLEDNAPAIRRASEKE